MGRRGKSDSKKSFVSLAELGPLFYQRQWVPGTSGNFSVILRRNPLRIAITAGSVDKNSLSLQHILEVNAEGRMIGTKNKKRFEPSGTAQSPYAPSSESLLHLAIFKTTQCGAVLHTHSSWSAFISEVYGDADNFFLEGYEMLKGLAGIHTHEHREWIPILKNIQDRKLLAGQIRAILLRQPDLHGVLIRKHGLYTWGKSLEEAKHHVEIFEFLFETVGRLRLFFCGDISRDVPTKSKAIPP